MTDTASNFVGEIPENYDRYLGPNLFDRYAREIAERAAALQPRNVLELAAGSGIVTRHLRDALPGDVPITATDLNGPMLEVAQAKFRPGDNMTFMPADAQDLAFPDESFDLILCQFGLMFFPDRVKSYREAARVLRPGGAYLFSSWGTIERNPATQIADQVLAETFPEDPPNFYSVPFFYNDIDQVHDEVQQGGLEDFAHHETAHDKVVDDFDGFATGLVFGNPAFQEIRERGGDPDAIRASAAQRMRDRFGPEPASMPLVAHMFEARSART